MADRRFQKTRKAKRRQTKDLFSPGPSQCHPRVGKQRPAAGCLPVSILQRAAKKVGLNTEQSGLQLRKALEQQFQVAGGQELSFVKALPFVESEKEYLMKQYLRPAQPTKWKEDPDMWLDSLNIESVMKQYEEANPHFEFMGPFPIDFAAPDPYQHGGEKRCLIREMCGLRVQESAQAGKRYIGIVYNLDPHFKDGSHWVANFVDIPRHQCYYFDSYGMKPPKQIATFMKWLTTQDPKMKLSYNAHRFQHQGSECGMYSMYFIVRMLMGEPFRPFCRREPPDAEMLDLRDWFFST